MPARRIVIFATIIQSILFLAHGLVYATWSSFWGRPAHGSWKLQVLAALLSVSFVSASLLAWRYSHVLVRLFYTAAAVWLGLLNFLFFASFLCWLLYGAAHFLDLHVERRVLVGVCFGLAFIATLYGLVNAGWIRVTTLTVKLPNLPQAWRGRVAALGMRKQRASIITPIRSIF